jgi:signal recognition particle GTPase
MEDALLRILTPRRSIDILRDVHAAKERGRPYVIVFVGVNGVGKSTNLAKVCISRHHITTIYKKKRNPFLGIFIHCLHLELHRLLIGFFSITSV